MHSVVVILGVRRIDRDERHSPPIFTALERRGPCGVGVLLGLASEYGWNAVRMDSDEAHRSLAFERTEPLDHATGRRAKVWRARGLDGNQIAIFGVGGCSGGNNELLAEHLLVDRLQAAAAVLDFSEKSPTRDVWGDR